MSAKGTYTTAEPLDWDEAISLMNRLFGPVKALFRRKQKTVSGGDA